MNRQEVIELLKNQEAFPIDKAQELISEYCKQKGKSVYDTDKLIRCLMLVPNLMIPCVRKALEYFTIKYEICKITDLKTNKVIHIY